MAPYFNIIQSLCRACFSSDLDVITHQIERLISAYRADGNIDEAKALEKMLNNAKNKEKIKTLTSYISSSIVQRNTKLTNIYINILDKKKKKTPLK